MNPGDAGDMTKSRGSDRSVVVGVDGSEGSRVALEWALDKADRLGSVRTVTTFRHGLFGDGFATPVVAEPGVQIYKEAAEHRLNYVLGATDPALAETASVVESKAGPALVEAGDGASLLVVGNRGRSALAETLLGSVGSYCVKHSKVPVAVITADTPTKGPLSRIAVGVDGSESARVALTWAIDHVDPDGTVIAIGAFDPAAYAVEGYAHPLDLPRKQTRIALEESVAAVVGNGKGGPQIDLEVRLGDPRSELRAAGAEADLLVIGARGQRTVAYLLVGSVATSLLHHPTCATVVVP